VLQLSARVCVCNAANFANVTVPQDHVDYLCCQAVMFGRTSSNLFSQAKLIFIRSRRLG
jgi:hypothetical protein